MSKLPPGLISKEERLQWGTPGRFRLLLDLASIYIQAGLGIWLYQALPSWPTYLVALFVIGGAQHCAGLAAHEGAHYLLWPSNRENNDRITRWGLASPVLLPFSIYRVRHFAHHRLVSQEDDTKELYRYSLRGWRFWWETFHSLSGLQFCMMGLKVVMNLGGKKEKPEKKSADPKKDFLSLLIVQVSIIVLLGGPWNYILLWVVPLVTFAQWFAKLRSLVEHRPLRSERGEGPYYLGTETPHLRSVMATPWERLFLSRLNFHYHAEHHLLPQVSYQYLPTINRRLRERDDHHIVFDDSYSAVIMKLWRGE